MRLSLPHASQQWQQDEQSVGVTRIGAHTTVRNYWIVLAGIALLVLGVATDRYGLEVSGFNFRYELIIGGLLLVGYVLWRGIPKSMALARKVGLVEYCLVAWVVVSYVSTLLFSPMRLESLKLTVLVTGFVVLYFVGFAFIRSARAVKWAALAWVSIGAVVAMLGMLDSLLWGWFGWMNGVTLEAGYSSSYLFLSPKIHSTMWEPNLFGSFCLSVGVIGLTLSCAPEYRTGRMALWLKIAGAAGFGGVMLSMTRTLWLVAPFVLLVFLAVCLWRKVAGVRQLAAGVALPALVGIAIGFALGFIMPSYSVKTIRPITPQEQQQIVVDYQNGHTDALSRVAAPAPTATPTPVPQQGSTGGSGGKPGSGAVTPSESSALKDRVTDTFSNPSEITSWVGRQRLYKLALKGWLEKPILGWGTGSFAAYDPSEDKWIGNLELHVLFDTGLVGFLLLGTAFFVPVWNAFRALKVPRSRWNTGHFILLGLLVAGFGLMLAYQTTEGLWLGFTWVFLAMLVAATRYQPAAPEAAALTSPVSSGVLRPGTHANGSNGASTDAGELVGARTGRKDG